MRSTALVVLGAVALSLAACSSSGPPRDLTPPDLFQWAHDQFDAGEYRKAAEGFFAYMLREPMSPLVDSAQYLAAEGRLRAGDELDAIEEFRRMATGRPNSPLADDAQLGLCRAYLSASPRVSLSQEFTRRAIEECGRLLQFFPTTPFRAEAERLMAEAQAKLSQKSYEIGKYYQDNRRLPESAIVYYEISLSEQPAEDFLPDLLWRLYQTYRQVGYETEAGSVRDRLLSEFPDSEEAGKLAAEEDPAGNAGASL
ncbi:outer membrane protein assembly factor BamD [Candidatus Palauibacter sp.]|uniref:outer membrane protein assembly factor BamD n=1 Tax=Candidatus Palauibacter sp. TaxID=3101350 RepID=UPI003B599CAE